VHSDFDQPKEFDHLATVASVLTVLAYAACFAIRRIRMEGIDFNVTTGVFLGSLGAILSVWVLLRRSKYHRDSFWLAAFNLFLCAPLACCGWGAINH